MAPLARQILQWREAIAGRWPKLTLGHVHRETIGNFHNFRVQVYLDELEPDAVLVELYAQGRNGEPSVRKPMTRGDALAGAVNGFI